MSGIEDIPVIGGIAETAIHGAEAVGHAVDGDWDKAANSALDMAGSAAHTALDLATDGVGSTVLDTAEGVYNAAAGGLGLPSTDDMWEGAKHGVEAAGNALGDAAYHLVNGSDDSGLGAPGLDAGGLINGGFDDPGLAGGGGLGGGDFGGGDLGDGGLGGGDLGGGDFGGGDLGGGDLGGGDMSGGDDGGYDMGGGDMSGGDDGGEY